MKKIVPKEKLLRKINDLVDFSFIDDEFINKYCLIVVIKGKKQ